MQQTAGICVVSLQLANAALHKLCACVTGANGCAQMQQICRKVQNKKAFLQPCPAASCITRWAAPLPELKMSSAAWVDLPALKTSDHALKTSNPAQLVPTEANVIMSVVFTAS